MYNIMLKHILKVIYSEIKDTDAIERIAAACEQHLHYIEQTKPAETRLEERK